MGPAELATYRQCTGRTNPPSSPVSEGWLICGRRSGKSYNLALVSVFIACFKDWRPFLAAGEKATVMVLAADRRQARVILNYIKGLLIGTPMLARLIERETTEAIDLRNRVSIEVVTASFRTTRGYTVCACLFDEIAFWSTDDSANPDAEIVNAIRPAMATLPGSILLAASSPYAKRGELWRTFQRYYGKDDAPTLVWRAPSTLMNPSLPQALVDAAMERDPAHAAAEFMAEFRDDIASYVSDDAVLAVVSPGVRERPRAVGVEYVAFVDAAGGSGSDSMTIAIAHTDGEGRAVLDAVREVKPPFSPESAVQQFASLLRSYGISEVTGDRYAGQWPAEAFGRANVGYEPADKTKSDLYLNLLPMINSGQVELLDDDRLVRQLCGLERRTARGGRDSIDHGPGAHDDIAAARQSR